MILDEIQTGLGRTGKMWASEHWGVVPDIMTVSKGLGGGIPIGAAIAKDEVANSLKGGEHTSTFAGNPLSAGVIFAYSGRDTFRFLPALVIEESQISKGLEVLERVIGEEEASRF